MLDKPNISGYLSRIGRREFNWTIRIVVNLFRITEFDIIKNQSCSILRYLIVSTIRSIQCEIQNFEMHSIHSSF